MRTNINNQEATITRSFEELALLGKACEAYANPIKQKAIESLEDSSVEIMARTLGRMQDTPFDFDVLTPEEKENFLNNTRKILKEYNAEYVDIKVAPFQSIIDLASEIKEKIK